MANEMTVAFAALAPLMSAHTEREISEAIAEARAEGRDHVVIDIGLNPGSMRRAGIYFSQHVSGDEADIATGASEAFVQAWSLGEREAYRRMMVALSSPEAKGREIDVLAALMNGVGVIDALAGNRPAPVTQAGNVVALRPQRVADASEAE